MRAFFLIAAFIAAAVYYPSEAQPQSTEETTLKEAYSNAFHIGAAIYAERLSESDDSLREAVSTECNSISSRDMLKWAWLNPEPGTFNTNAGDQYVTFGQKHAMYVVGHVLFWHQATPQWVWTQEDGSDVSRKTLLDRMRRRAQFVAERYGDRVRAWDVVNEAFLEDGSLRRSPWTRILGDSFVADAFRIANEELPRSVDLIYNDYNMHLPKKRRAVVGMIKDLKSKGIRIDGVGMQAHWHLDQPKPYAIETSIKEFHKAGASVHITELDLSVLPYASGERTDENDPYVDGLPKKVEREQARRYANLFRLFLKHADKIKRVTFWGISDAYSFKNNFPIKGRTDHPVLINREGDPKLAFEAVLRAGQAAQGKLGFAWKTGPTLFDMESYDEPDWIAMKDPSIVRYQGKWHLFCTLRGHERSHATVYTSFKTFEEALSSKPVVLPNHDGYFCAPQVFFYRPQAKWYMVCQAKNEEWNPVYQAAYATTEDISDPNSWSPLKPMRVARPKDGEKSPYLDFWIIRDGDDVFNFFTSDNGKMWRCKTSAEDFPKGWSNPALAYEGDIFEASHIYRLPSGRYANLIEAQGRSDKRYFKILFADDLEGQWLPPASGDERYAYDENITFEDGPWANSISHGELIRSGIDERMNATLHSPFFFQGVMMKDRKGKPYGKIPWKVGVLRQLRSP
ncbi:MAG: non-reducing end alpha-L-arabinofuranosidase family hydrolase [Planctomycetota bacterium]